MELFIIIIGFPILCVILRNWILDKIEQKKEDRLAKKIAAEMQKLNKE